MRSTPDKNKWMMVLTLFLQDCNEYHTGMKESWKHC